MSLITAERRERRQARPSHAEAKRKKIVINFETAVDKKIALAKDSSQNAYHESVEGAHLIYLRHPEEPGRRIAILELTGSLVFQFEPEKTGIKRSLYGWQDRQRIASRMLSLDTATALDDFISEPWTEPVEIIERIRIITELSPTERALAEAKGLRIQDPQPTPK